MKIKEEPIDLEYERVISKTTIDVSCVKLDSTVDGVPDPHHLLLNGQLNGVLLPNNDHVDVEGDVPLNPVQIPTVSANVHLNSSLPAYENWPGEYQFGLSFRPQAKSTKGISWTYSRIKDKLYVGKDVPCPINISTNAKLKDVYIRVMALYASPEQVTEKVERCIHHSKEEYERGVIEAMHLIRCESPTATYEVDPLTGRHSVVVPFENSPAGQAYSTYIYKFTCFTSCPGGPNRRPLMLIFTLEKGNEVLGRRKIDVKICACPGRDRKTDEAAHVEPEAPNPSQPQKRKLNTTDFVNLSSYMSFTKNVYVPPLKKKCKPNKDGNYTLQVDDKECFDFLKQMKKMYDICKVLKGIPPEALSNAFNGMLAKTPKSEED